MINSGVYVLNFGQMNYFDRYWLTTDILLGTKKKIPTNNSI